MVVGARERICNKRPLPDPTTARAELALAAEAPDIVLPDGTAIDFKTYGRPCAACGDPCPAGQRWCSRSCHRAEDGDHSNEA